MVKEAKEIETTKPGSEFEDVAHLGVGQRGKRGFTDGDVNAGVGTFIPQPAVY